MSSRCTALRHTLRILLPRRHGFDSHLNFTDAAVVSALIDGPQRRWMRWGPIDGERGLRITADLVRAFFDHALLGRPADTLLLQPELRYRELCVVPPSR